MKKVIAFGLLAASMAACAPEGASFSVLEGTLGGDDAVGTKFTGTLTWSATGMAMRWVEGSDPVEQDGFDPYGVNTSSFSQTGSLIRTEEVVAIGAQENASIFYTEIANTERESVMETNTTYSDNEDETNNTEGTYTRTNMPNDNLALGKIAGESESGLVEHSLIDGEDQLLGLFTDFGGLALLQAPEEGDAWDMVHEGPYYNYGSLYQVESISEAGRVPGQEGDVDVVNVSVTVVQDMNVSVEGPLDGCVSMESESAVTKAGTVTVTEEYDVFTGINCAPQLVSGEMEAFEGIPVSADFMINEIDVEEYGYQVEADCDAYGSDGTKETVTFVWGYDIGNTQNFAYYYTPESSVDGLPAMTSVAVFSSDTDLQPDYIFALACYNDNLGYSEDFDMASKASSAKKYAQYTQSHSMYHYTLDSWTSPAD